MSRLYVESVEEDCPPTEGIIHGKLPKWLRGTLYRNGPSLYKFGDTQMKHLFDGMAAVQKWSIKDGKVSYQRKFINSEAYQKNSSVNRVVMAEFGTYPVPDPCLNIFQRFMSHFELPEATDNTAVTVWPLKDRVFVSTETEKIHEIDPESLETLQGVKFSEFITVNQATAHTHWEEDGTVHCFGYKYKGKDAKFTMFKIPPKEDSSEAFSSIKAVSSVPFRWQFYPNYVHSFSLTEDFYVVVDQPLCFSIVKLLSMSLAQRSFEECFSFFPKEKSIFHIINRKTGERLNPSITYYGDAMFTFHHINAYQDGDFLILDLSAYNDNQIMKTLYLKNWAKENFEETVKNAPKAIVRRYAFPLTVHKHSPLDQNLIKIPGCTATAVKKSDTKIYCQYEEKDNNGLELPQVNYPAYNGKKYRYAYGIGRENLHEIRKLDMEKGDHKSWSESGYSPSEPVFVPTPGATEEDDGVVLSAISPHDENRQAFLLVLNGKTFKEDARVVFNIDRFSRDFHGFFRPEIPEKIS